MEEGQKITVEIFGEKHVVRGNSDPDYVQGLAREVDKKMRLLAQRLPRLPVERLAILTALNLADELAKLREEQESLMELMGETKE